MTDTKEQIQFMIFMGLISTILFGGMTAWFLAIGNYYAVIFFPVPFFILSAVLFAVYVKEYKERSKCRQEL